MPEDKPNLHPKIDTAFQGCPDDLLGKWVIAAGRKGHGAEA